MSVNRPVSNISIGIDEVKVSLYDKERHVPIRKALKEGS